jgi:hypothetical protein
MEGNSVNARDSSSEGIHSAELISFLKTQSEIVLRPTVSWSFSQSFIQYVCPGVEPLLWLITRILRAPVDNYCRLSWGIVSNELMVPSAGP